jgi:uncharacterized membrane protein YphA (DoxX/SURF4 family)
MKNIIKFIFIITMLVAIFLMPNVAFADEEVCTQSYGQPVVCGVTTPKEQEVVKAGLEEDLRLVGLVLVIASSGLYLYSKRPKSSTSFIVKY